LERRAGPLLDLVNRSSRRIEIRLAREQAGGAGDELHDLVGQEVGTQVPNDSGDRGGDDRRDRRARQRLGPATARTGAILVDFHTLPAASDYRLWSDDRLHANALGHERTAEALAHALGLPGTDEAWRDPLPGLSTRTPTQRLAAEADWVRRHLAPWLWRHLRGKSSGDGLTCKRPELRPIPGDLGD
jgi:hypothetical protein